jgi:hypothetical protein
MNSSEPIRVIRSLPAVTGNPWFSALLRRRRIVTSSLGQRPRIREIKRDRAALKARFIVPSKNVCAIETRFQRFGHLVNRIPGALPQAAIE